MVPSTTLQCHWYGVVIFTKNLASLDSTYCNHFNDKQQFVVIPLTNSTALSMSFIAGSLSMFTLCCLLKSSFYVANKALKDCFLHVGATHSHKQFKMAVNYMYMYMYSLI